MKRSLQINSHQILEPKEILRQRTGQYGSQYLVKWSLIVQNTQSAGQSDTSSTTDGKNDKSILIWMTEEEVQVVCSELLGAGFGSKSRKLDDGGHQQESEATDGRDSEDFEDMLEDVRKLVIRARKQMRRTGSKDEPPIKNISYTLKILSTYASLGSLASVFRQTGALDLILELLWSKEVETRRHAGRMLRALASHDAGSRAYVLLSLIQDRPGHTTCGDDNADFENRNTVMEMFAETSSGEEANAFSLDFIQLPQVPGKALFRLMKCYLKVTSLLDMDSQLGDMSETKTTSSADAENELQTAKSTSLSSSCHRFDVAMAIADLIFELSEVMGWNIKILNIENDTVEKNTQEKDENNDIKQKPVGVVNNYLKEFASFVAKTNENLPRDEIFSSFNMEMFYNDVEPLPSPDERQRFLREGLLSFADSSTSTNSTLNKAGDSADAVILDPEMTNSSSRCIFSSKRKETVDAKLLSNLIKDSIPYVRFAYKTASMFPTVQQYVNYLKSILKVGWKVRMMTDDDLVREGDEGVVRKFKDNDEPGGLVEVVWLRLSETVSIKPQNLEIIGCPKSDKTGIHPDVPEYLQNPESSKLWPRLISSDITKVSSHPYSSGLGVSYQALLQGPSTSATSTKSLVKLMTQRQWWEVLFFIGKLPQGTAENAVKEIYDDIENGQFSPSACLSNMTRDKCTVIHLNGQFPTFKYVSSLIQRIVDQNPIAENLFRKSMLCSRFLKPKEQKNEVKPEQAEKNDSEATESKEKDEKQNNAGGEMQVQDLTTETVKDTTDDTASSETLKKEDTEIECEANNGDELMKETPDSNAKAGEDPESDAVGEGKELRQKIRLYLSYLCKQNTTFLDTSMARLLKLKQFVKENPKKLSQFIRSSTTPEAILDHVVSGLCSSDEELLVMMVFVHIILLRYQTSGFSNLELNRIIFHLQNVPLNSDREICLAWMECVRIMLAIANVNPSSMRGTELIVATSGCLARLFQIIKWFFKCKECTVKAVQCLNLATRAVKTYTAPHSGTFQSGEVRIIQEIIASIASASPILSSSESSTTKSDQDSGTELPALISSLDMILDHIEKSIKDDGKRDSVKWQDTDSSEVGILYEGLCVSNMLVTGHKDLVSQVHETLSPLLKRGLKLCPMTSPLHDLMISIQGKLCDFAPEDDELTILDIGKIKETKSSINVEEKETKSFQSVSDKLEGAMDELLNPKNFPKLISSPNRLLDFLQAILDDESLMLYPQVTEIVNTLFPSIVFPNMNQKMSVEQLSRCVDIIQRVIIEPSQTIRPSSSTSLSHILEEKHRSQAISSLLQLIDSLSSTVLRANLESTNSSSLKEVIVKAVSLLLRLVDLDRDTAVIMCGLDAKQSLQKAIERHESIPQASELMDCLQGYEKYKSLHSKLLVVVLRGTIGVALRCLEDSRRMQERLEIPLLSGLFESLCQGSDFDLKEDKCWERIEVSSNHRQSSKLTDGNPKTYWESNGSSGSHWINIYMKKGVFVRKMTLFISPEDSSYMPARFVVMGGTRPSDISHTISQINVSSTDSQLVVMENEKRYWPIIRISVRRCQQGGIDTRIRGFEIIGPKPSFWPVLHQQLYIRTSLAYFVKAQVWISSCLDESKNELGIKENGLLNLPSKIIQAIQHEQEFANMFLPTDESALVLGQAFRHAVVNPLVTAILDIDEGKTLSLEDVIDRKGDGSVYDPRSNCLMYKLLATYLDESKQLIDPDSCSNASDRMQQALFTSRLRCLTRLLVDLNPGSNVSNKPTPSRSVSPKDWNQRVQTKSNKHLDSARSTRGKPSAVPSVHSLNHGSPGTSKLQDCPPNDHNDEDSYDSSPTPGLMPLASLWSAIITERFYSFFVTHLRGQRQFSFSLNDHESACPEIQFCKDLVKEYEHTRTCTTELFGSSVKFLMEYIKGISAAVGSLDGYCTVTLSKNLVIALHRTMVDYNRRGPFGCINRDPFYKTDEFLDKLTEFFCLANNLDWAYGFEQLYCNLLALRILIYNLTWIEREKQLCDSLRPCFPDSRPCEMLKDVMQSQTLWRGFVSHKMEMVDTLVQLEKCQVPYQKRQAVLAMVDEDSKNFRLLRNGLSVRVLSPVSWRLHAIRLNAVPGILGRLNSSLLPILRDYERFFQCAYHTTNAPKNTSSRRLHWTGEGWAEMVDTISGVTMHVTTPQMLLLLHFVYVKHKKKITDRKVDIADWKLAFPHHWKSALNSLVLEKLVREIDENIIVLNSKVFEEGKNYEGFGSVGKGVMCRLFPMDMENTILKSSHHLEQLTERRQNLIECAIIQLLKKKTCGIDMLVHDVVKYCLGDNPVTLPELNTKSSSKGTNGNNGWKLPSSHRFFPTAAEVHARIKNLIDRGYIKRDSERPYIVEYLPEPQPLRSRTSTVSTFKQDDFRSDDSKGADDEAEAESLPITSQTSVASNAVTAPPGKAEDKSSIAESTEEENWKTAESSSSLGLVANAVTDEVDPYPSTVDVFTDLVNEDTSTHKSKETYKRTKASFCIVNDLEVWQLKLGFCEITIQKQEYTCQSLTIQKIILVIKKAINSLSKVLHCRISTAEALLLQLDWSIEDIVEHYVNDRAATLSSIGIISEEQDGDKQEKENKSDEEAECDAETADQSEGCPVCTGEMKPKESLALQCKHRCCLSCWKCYLYQKLEENQAVTVKCPVTKCDARPTLTAFRIVFAEDKRTIQRYCTALVRSYVESDRSLTWCHCPIGCETVIRKGSSGNNTGTCSVCGWETCFDCSYVEAHYPASCGHMSQWMEDGGYYEGMGEDARSKHLARIIAKRCPNCQANIEKEDGCLHMKCLKCSHDFCWRCLKPWRPTHRDYYKCTAKVSKLAHAGIRFQEHNKRCQYHHKAKELPLSVIKRLMTVDAELLSPIRLSHAIKTCVLLIKIRKVLAYSNIFSYYSIDTEHMKTMDYYSQVLENGALLIQGKIERLLLGHADINYAVNHMSINDMRGIDEMFKDVTMQLKNLLTFSAQDMKVAVTSSNEKVEIPATGEGASDNLPSGTAVIVNARPAGMSDQDTDNDDMEPVTSGFSRDFHGTVTELEGAVDRLLGVGYGEDNPFGNYNNGDNNGEEEEDDDDDDEDDDDIDEYFSSSPDSFSEDSDDDDENRGSEDTMDTDYANDEDTLFDPFMF